jgi:hypothetical protein
MLKKGLVFPIVIVVAIFLTLSATMFFLQDKSLVGFVTYADIGEEGCGYEANITGETYVMIGDIGVCVSPNADGPSITGNNIIFDCDDYNINGSGVGDGGYGIIVMGTNVTIQNCNITNFADDIFGTWYDCGNNICDGVACEGGLECQETECANLITNSSWSEWQNLSCLLDDTMNQSRNLTEYDANNCGNFSNITHYEYQTIGPTYANTSWSSWIDEGCTGDEYNLSRSLTQYDIYSCAENITFYEFNLTGPEYDYTDWAEWDNETCVEDEMNQSTTRTKFDIYSCADNVTEYDYQLTGPTYITISTGEWVNSSCVNSSSINQSREINQTDIYSCADNQTITEYQDTSCASGYSCSSGVCTQDDTGGGSPGGGGCTPSTCSSLGKTCGNWSNGCGGTLNCGTCLEGYNCEDGTCVIQETPCEDECNIEDYPRCKDSITAELCLLNSTSNCYYKKNDACSERENCINGTCIIETTEETEEDNEITKVVEGITNLAKKPSSIIPHGNIPEVVVDTATYTATTVVIATGFHFLWLWLISLFLPVFLLRLKHYCLAFIDTKTILPFVKYEYNKQGSIKNTSINKKEIEKFISILQKQFRERIILTESIENSYRFLFEKSGFIEIQLDAPVIINVHFSSSRRTKHFRKAFLNTIKIIYGAEKMKKVKSSLILTKESTTIIKSLRNISRERKLKKLSNKFRK